MFCQLWSHAPDRSWPPVAIVTKTLFFMAWKALYKSSVWAFRVLMCGHGGHGRHQLCLSKCSKRNHRRHSIVLKGFSTNIWVLRLQIYEPGALEPYLSNCSRRNHRRRRSELVSSARANQVFGCPDHWYMVLGLTCSVWAYVVREEVSPSLYISLC